jgi:citrate lyase beta subunit
MDIETASLPKQGTARRQIAASLDQVAARARSNPDHRARFVRINAVGHQRMHDDLAAVVSLASKELAVPKVEPRAGESWRRSWTSASEARHARRRRAPAHRH